MTIRFLAEFLDERRQIDYPDIRPDFTDALPIEELVSTEVPRDPGLYIIKTSGLFFNYPWGTSTVYYIGKPGACAQEFVMSIKT